MRRDQMQKNVVRWSGTTLRYFGKPLGHLLQHLSHFIHMVYLAAPTCK